MMVMNTSVCVTRDTQDKTVLMVTITIIITNFIICNTIRLLKAFKKPKLPHRSETIYHIHSKLHLQGLIAFAKQCHICL